MNNIEDIIKATVKNNIDIPVKIQNRINYTLRNKRKGKFIYYFRNFITAIISIICAMIGSLSVYAACGGTIEGKTVIEWLGMNFSSNYDEYKEEVVNQQISYNETTIDLISTLSGEGFTILEFDVKVSDEDKEYLRLGEKVITEKDWEDAKEEYENGSDKSLGTPFEETFTYKEYTKNENLVNTLALNLDNQTDDNKMNNIVIDDVGYYVMTIQTTNKIADNEYKVYQLYLLTDEILNGKENFKISLKNIALENRGDYKKEENETMYLSNTANNKRSINIDGEVNSDISKEKTDENSKIIDNITQEIKYKKMTEKIEKVSETPIQTVVRISKVYNNIDLHDIASAQDKDYIGVEEYTVKDNNGNEISSVSLETKRVITYSNGKQEEWYPGDIGTYINFTNAKLETIEYLIIEHKDNISSLKITSNIEEIAYTESQDNWIEAGEFNIDISN